MAAPTAVAPPGATLPPALHTWRSASASARTTHHDISDGPALASIGCGNRTRSPTSIPVEASASAPLAASLQHRFEHQLRCRKRLTGLARCPTSSGPRTHMVRPSSLREIAAAASHGTLRTRPASMIRAVSPRGESDIVRRTTRSGRTGTWRGPRRSEVWARSLSPAVQNGAQSGPRVSLGVTRADRRSAADSGGRGSASHGDHGARSLGVDVWGGDRGGALGGARARGPWPRPASRRRA